MRIIYDLVVWEEVDENDTEALKGKFTEFGKRLGSYGILSFSMRAGGLPQGLSPEQQAQQQQQIQYAQQQQQIAQQQQQIAQRQAQAQAETQAQRQPKKQIQQIPEETEVVEE